MYSADGLREYGLRVNWIAKQMGVPEATLRYHLRSGLTNEMRKKLERVIKKQAVTILRELRKNGDKNQ
jgi:predicted transcriptional regulator